MLDYEIWGNSVQTWIVSLLIIAGAFIVVKLLSLLGRKVIKPFIGRTSNRVDDILYYSLESAPEFAVMRWASGSPSIGWSTRIIW